MSNDRYEERSFFLAEHSGGLDGDEIASSTVLQVRQVLSVEPLLSKLQILHESYFRPDSGENWLESSHPKARGTRLDHKALVHVQSPSCGPRRPRRAASSKLRFQKKTLSTKAREPRLDHKALVPVQSSSCGSPPSSAGCEHLTKRDAKGCLGLAWST